MNLFQTDLTVSTGIHQYSCAASCTAGTLGGVTTTCCYANSDCNTKYTLATCFVGTDNSAVSSSCTNSGFCQVYKKIDRIYIFVN